jgi:hypothetical protein
MSNFKFLDFVTEGKMIRSSDGVSRMSFTDACDLTLLYFLALSVMRHYPISRNYVRTYANEVLKWQNWEYFRSSANDLYGLLNIIDGDIKIVSKLKDPKNALLARTRSTLPTMAVKRLLRNMANGQRPTMDDGNVLYKIDLGLRNSSYSNLRRKVASYTSLSTREKKEVVTQLEFALKARGRNADLIDYFILFVSDYDLESKTAKDTEPTVSVPDPIPANTKDIQMLRMLGVPNKDLPFAYKVLSITSRGLPIPSRFAQAYQPIMQIIDDIVKAGPGYVNLLKQVHNRAKRAKN